MDTKRHSFAEWDAWLNHGRSKAGRPVRKNLRARRLADGSIAVRLYRTDVVVWRPDGAAVLDHGGWNTPTTFQAIRDCGPKVGPFPASDKGVAGLFRWDGEVRRSWRWDRPAVILPDGTVEGLEELPPHRPAACPTCGQTGRRWGLTCDGCGAQLRRVWDCGHHDYAVPGTDHLACPACRRVVAARDAAAAAADAPPAELRAAWRAVVSAGRGLDAATRRALRALAAASDPQDGWTREAIEKAVDRAWRASYWSRRRPVVRRLVALGDAAVELALAVGVERRPSWARYGDVAVLAELAACSDVPEAPEARRRVGVWRAYCAAEDQRWMGASALAWDDKEAGKARAAECEDHARRLEDRARELAAACAAGEAE